MSSGNDLEQIDQTQFMPIHQEQFIGKLDTASTKASMKSIAAVTSLVALLGLGVYTDAHHYLADKMGLTLDSFQDNDTVAFSEYLSFVAKYGKTDTSQDEFKKRYAIFSKNYQRIIDHNAIGVETTQFTMGVNKFTDLTDEEFVARQASGVRVP